MVTTLTTGTATAAVNAITAGEWLRAFERALTARDIDGALELFADDCYWRDFLPFTWNLETLEGKREIAAMLDTVLDRIRPSGWRVIEVADGEGGDTDCWIRFETGTGHGYGHLRLRGGRCHVLLTTLDGLRGHSEGVGPQRPERSDERDTGVPGTPVDSVEDPYCLVVGGGQSGIGLAARLTHMGVPTVVVDRDDRPGDSWRNRYESLHLHDPVWNCHMPLMPFPEHWPVYMSKDDMGDWLEHYTALMRLRYWTRTECVSAEYDEEAGRWRVELSRDGESRVLNPVHVVFAMGVSGHPAVPSVPGAETFRGEQYHSTAHPGGVDWSGRKAVVVGSSNSAHDISADLWRCGAEVTMVQRSSALVVRLESVIDFTAKDLYSEEALASGMSVERADHLSNSLPLRIMPQVEAAVYKRIAEHDAEFYSQLGEAGFRYDFGEDGSGMVMKYLRRGSGYYIDVGTSEMVVDGRVGVVNGEIAELVPSGLRMADSTFLEADLIVYATGFRSMSERLADLISPEAAERVGPCWGYGSGTQGDPGPWEGELRNMWKPTALENLWFHGGNLSMSRYFSRYLAFQIKARMEGLPTPVYSAPRSEA